MRDVAEKKAELRARFRAERKMDDTRLDFEELVALLPDLDHPIAHSLFYRLDKTGDGVIDFDELVEYVYSPDSPVSTDEKMVPRARARHTLASGAVRLLSATWLIARGEAYILQRLQDLPEDAFLPPHRAVELFDFIGGIVVVSYGWLSRKHPDPTGFHLRTVQKYLKKHRTRGFWAELGDYGVFWDFASLPQDQPSGARKTEQERLVLEEGLGAVGLLCGDSKTVVVQLTRMPEELRLDDGSQGNLAGYRVRGWCFFETAVCSFLKKPDMLLDLGVGTAVLECEGAAWWQVQEAAGAEKPPPLTPEDMATELRKRTFTNGGDLEVVTRLYAEFVREAAPGAESLSFGNASGGPGWSDAELGQLARSLPAFAGCRVINLFGHGALGERGLAELRVQLPRCLALRVLRLPRHLRETGAGRALGEAAEAGGPQVVWC